MEYHGIVMGGKIYSLRVAKGMTQEQLAAVLCVSPAAVSKWERNLATPGIEMLWMLADFFDCTIDELVGRSQQQLQQLGDYDNAKARMAEVAGDLLECCELARQEGLLALDSIAKRQPKNKSGRKSFLAFAINFFLTEFYKQVPPDIVFDLLQNYAETLPEEERAEGRMIAATLKRITNGENPMILQEVIASYVGMEYREKMDGMNEYLKLSPEEIITKYKDKPQYSEATGLLNVLKDAGDFEIQTILRNIDNNSFTCAMYGASGEIVVKFLRNLSDRLLRFLSEDLDKCNCTEEQILQAQRRVLEVGAFAVEQKA